MRRSHKARLATVSTAVAALVMGGVFVGVGVLVRRAALREERDEIAQAFGTVEGLGQAHFSMKELGEAGPALNARVRDAAGRLIDSRGRMPDPPPDLAFGFRQSGDWLFFAGRVRAERIVIARNLTELERGQKELETILLALWLPLSGLVGGATWLAAQSVFRSLTRLAEAASTIEGTDLAQRLPAPDQAEFGALAHVLNRMLARIQEAALRSERFAADAAHELRTPLALVRAQIETTLLRPRTSDEYVASHLATLEEAERLSALTEALLRSARDPVAESTFIDLAPLVRAVAARHAPSALRLRLSEAYARVSPEDVEIVLGNLLDNARRFAPPGSEIEVRLTKEIGAAELRVIDHGTGIPPEHAERVFERLYRIDEDRNRSSGGAGIGLAVCRRLVASRGGTIEVEATPGGGASLVVRWPAPA